MEVFLMTFIAVMIMGWLYKDFVLLRKIEKINTEERTLVQISVKNRQDIKEISEMVQMIGEKQKFFQQYINSLPKEPPQAPIRPNNFDSLREAFKGPARVDERN